MDWLIDPFRWEFMRMGLLAAFLVGTTCATLGAYVVLRRMAFIGDALSHTALPGLVVAYLNGWSLFGGAVVAGLLTALGIGWLSRREGVREDTAIGVLFTAMFAAGILLLSQTRSFRDLTHILFGNILGVSETDLILIGIVAVVVLLALAAFHKELELTSCDPLYAESIGLRADLLRYGLLLLLALAVVVGIQAVGVVLTSALLVTPAAAASLVTDRLPRLMGIAVLIAVGASMGGLYASYVCRCLVRRIDRPLLCRGVCRLLGGAAGTVREDWPGPKPDRGGRRRVVGGQRRPPSRPTFATWRYSSWFPILSLRMQERGNAILVAGDLALRGGNDAIWRNAADVPCRCDSGGLRAGGASRGAARLLLDLDDRPCDHATRAGRAVQLNLRGPADARLPRAADNHREARHLRDRRAPAQRRRPRQGVGHPRPALQRASHRRGRRRLERGRVSDARRRRSLSPAWRIPR